MGELRSRWRKINTQRAVAAGGKERKDLKVISEDRRLSRRLNLIKELKYG